MTADGRVFEGATEPPGARHAEIVALDAAGDAARGATLWVTLEPCAHTGRTGPCADALIAAGVARVVVGLADPDPHVAGRGIARLRDAGIGVEVVDDQAIAHDLRAYLTHRRLGRPFVTLKLAMTIDGATRTDPPGQWITGPAARADAHRLRAENDAILVGANTVRVDNPRLTTRDAAGPDPLRVVLGHAPADAAVQPCIEVSGDLPAVLQDLDQGITSLLIEGGEQTARAFHDAGLVDEYVFYVADASPDAAVPTWGLDVVAVTKIGNDVRVTLVPRKD